MPLDHFTQDQKDAFKGYSLPVAHVFTDVLERIGHGLHVVVEGLERLPSGRALLVGNHAFGFDVAFAMARIQAATGRRVWVLGEHAWWLIPLLRRLAAAVGTVDGTPHNADTLLSADELVLVLPGGLREAMKPRELRYRLLWGRRYGFVHAALRNGAPIVPLASVGADDLFDLVGDAFRRARRLRLPFPLPRPAHLIPVPHLRALRFVICEPIPVPHKADGGDAHDARRLRREIEGSLHEIFEEELTRRLRFGVSP